MKKVTIILASVMLMSIASLNAFADGGSNATANATASARIITPIKLTKTSDLNFGNIASSATEGTVTIAPQGSRTSGGGVTPSAIGDFTRAAYSATGENNATYNITLPGSITISSGTSLSMTVDNFKSTPTPTGTFSGSGAQTIEVGATLNVGANQASGSYQGTYNVTVAYN